MLFSSSIEPSCAYCRFGTALGFDEYACPKRGIMAGHGSCGSFQYEPTKREPEPIASLKRATAPDADFEL